jgi:hypothetical protein
MSQSELEIDDSGILLLPDQGETEEDLESHDVGQFRAALSAADWTVETLISQMRKDRIDLNPRFQRRNAWVDVRKSRLIESVILGYPIPQLVLAEQPDAPGHFFVIDGKQRLLALRQFCLDPSEPDDVGFTALRLSGLQVLTDLNGADWASLRNNHPEWEAQLDNHTIRTVFLSKWQSTDFLLSLFLRLNTGSVTLSPQELRQALHPGPFSDWLDDASIASPGLRRLLGRTEPDRRMVDAELLLRHLALLKSPSQYAGNLKRFLDDTTGAFNADWAAWEPELASGLAQLEAGIETMFEVFPEDGVCRKWTRTHFERPFNRALFDVMSVSFCQPAFRDYAPTYASSLVGEFKRLCDTNRRFADSISTTTKTLSAFKTRFDSWHRAVSRNEGLSFELPQALYY